MVVLIPRHYGSPLLLVHLLSSDSYLHSYGFLVLAYCVFIFLIRTGLVCFRLPSFVHLWRLSNGAGGITNWIILEDALLSAAHGAGGDAGCPTHLAPEIHLTPALVCDQRISIAKASQPLRTRMALALSWPCDYGIQGSSSKLIPCFQCGSTCRLSPARLRA